MSSWQAEYLARLKARDGKEKANSDLIDSYARLADRTARLTTAPPPDTSSVEPPGIARTDSARARADWTGESKPSLVAPIEDTLARLKIDLSEAQRSKADLQAQRVARTTEMDTLRSKYQTLSTRMQELSNERVNLLRRMRDKDEELKGKAKLLENVQDEVISLNIQLNMAERLKQELQKENGDLVDRWMARMGKEADAMNDASKFS